MAYMSFGAGVRVVSVAAVVLVGGCGTDRDVDAELGGESEPLVTVHADGGASVSCPPHKALICHVPPGNPANAHTLCVGKPAVDAHLRNHPDSLGACGATDAGAPVEPADAGSTPVPVDAGAPEVPVDGGTVVPDAGTCQGYNTPCTTAGQCCSGVCAEGFCVPQIG